MLVLIVAAACRVGVLAPAWTDTQRMMTPDSKGYLDLADSLIGGQGFQRDDLPEVFRTPGYPMFLLPGAYLGQDGLRAAIVAQVALDVLLVYLTFLLGTILLDRRAGLCAAGFQALAPEAMAASVRLLSDSLFAFLLTLAALLLVHQFRSNPCLPAHPPEASGESGKGQASRQGWWSLLSAAVVAAAACYVRPVGVTFCVIASAVLLAMRGGRARAGAFAGAVAALLLPWAVRNYVVADYAGFSSFAGDSMYYFSAPEVLAETGDGDAESQRLLMREKDEHAQKLSAGRRTSGQAARQRQREAMDVILAHPLAYAKVHLRGCAGFLLPGINDVLEIAGRTSGQRGTLDVLHRQGVRAAVEHYLGGAASAIWLCAPAAVLLAAKYGLCLVCAAACVARRWSAPAYPAWARQAGWLVALTVLVFALSGGPAATARFRIPVEPMLSAAAGCGLVVLLARRGKGATMKGLRTTFGPDRR